MLITFLHRAALDVQDGTEQFPALPEQRVKYTLLTDMCQAWMSGDVLKAFIDRKEEIKQQSIMPCLLQWSAILCRIYSSENKLLLSKTKK